MSLLWHVQGKRSKVSSTLEALTVDKFLAPFWSPQLWHVQGKRSKVSIAMFPERCVYFVASSPVLEPTSVACAETNSSTLEARPETQGLTQVESMILYSACLRPRFGAHRLGPVVHSGRKMEV